MKRYVVLGVVLFAGMPVFADDPAGTAIQATKDSISASEVSQQTTQQVSQTASQQPSQQADSPEDKAYKEAMIKISDEISKKIAQIQEKQKEIDTEVYLASKPPLIAEKNTLQSELQDLEMTRDRMQTEKTAKDLANQLKNSATNKAQQ